MWKNDQSLRELLEIDDTSTRKKRNATGDQVVVEGKFDHQDELVFNSEPSRKRSTVRATDEVTWYDKYRKLYATTSKARWILGVGLIVVNILVATYILLMYAFVSTVNTPTHGRDKTDSIWRTAGLVTILNSVPIIVSFTTLSSETNKRNVTNN